MFITAKAFFEDNTANNQMLIKQAETAMPREWVKRFRKNVRKQDRTPMDSGALRSSIITQAIGSRAQVGWRMPYAKAQEYGGHDYPGQYKNWSRPGTGPYFARDAFNVTNREVAAIVRELGLIK